jgi:hypothetical protein
MDTQKKCKTPVKTKSQAYKDLQIKAKTYLYQGPEKYKALVNADLKLEIISADLLQKIEHGMKQIMQGRGSTVKKAFTGLGVDGFYALTRILNLVTEIQELIFHGPAELVDKMQMVDSSTGKSFVLYNLLALPRSLTENQTQEDEAYDGPDIIYVDGCSL